MLRPGREVLEGWRGVSRAALLVSVGAVAALVCASTVSSGAAEPRWVITDLGVLARGARSAPTAINDRGWVVGWSTTRAGGQRRRAVLWRQGKIVDLGTLGRSGSQAFAVNSRGQIVGNAPGLGGPLQHAFLWQNGRMRDLGTLGGGRSWVLGRQSLNDRGQVVGASTDRRGRMRAFLWKDGGMTDLDSGGTRPRHAVAINNRGDIVGDLAFSMESIPSYPKPFLWRDGRTTVVLRHDLCDQFGAAVTAINERGQLIGTADIGTGNAECSFLWERGRLTDLGTLPGRPERVTRATALDDRGQVVGDAGGYPRTVAFLWQSGRLTSLGALPGDTTSHAAAINNRGQIVGTSGSPSGARAVLWQNGTVIDLGTLPGGRSSEAIAINDRGQIAGTSRTSAGTTHAVLWIARRG